MNPIMGKGHAVINIKATGFGKTRANFTQNHILAAVNAANIAIKIENKYKSIRPPQAELDLYLSQVSIAIICSVAALESKINEYLVDNKNKIDELPSISDAKVLKKYPPTNFSLSKQLFDSTNIIFKYDIIWFFKKKSLLPEYKHKQDLRYLTKLRNALTHFTPEWDNALLRHIDLEKDKKNRFTLNPFYPQAVLFFPYRCLSASCATWSCKVSNDFLELFKLLIR